MIPSIRSSVTLCPEIPTYITNYMGARSLIMKVERDELVEEIMNDYIEFNHWKKK